VVALGGAKPIGFLFLSSILVISLHPVGGRWIQEHYLTFPGDRETFSYYGPLNPVAFNVGYHNEHHDLMRVPWSRLPALRRMASEPTSRCTTTSGGRASSSASSLDPCLSLHGRITRSEPAPEKTCRDSAVASRG